VAELSIEFGDAMVRVSINDNGGGFRLPRRPEDLASLGKLGLAGMHERARLVGGLLMLKSRQGKGTAVTVEVPV
jgi:signal transduction histidine kinase